MLYQHVLELFLDFNVQWQVLAAKPLVAHGGYQDDGESEESEDDDDEDAAG
jgi:hypothetical protein